MTIVELVLVLAAVAGLYRLLTPMVRRLESLLLKILEAKE